MMTSDGDPDRRYREFAERHRMEARYGGHLWKEGASGILWKRRFSAFFERPAKYLVRTDSDVGFYRRFEFLPDEDCLFGTICLENNAGPRSCISGGIIGMTEGAARTILESGLLDSEVMRRCNHEWHGKMMASDDWAIADAAHLLGIRLYDHPEVACRWKDRTPNPGLKYAAVHPCKDAKL